MQIVLIYIAATGTVGVAKTCASMHQIPHFELILSSLLASGVNFEICTCVGELLHPPDLPIRAHRPTAANTLNLPQAASLDTGIKQPAIKSLLGP